MSAKILRPEGEIFEIAASEFRKYAALLTGESPEAVSEDDGASDLFILGNDAENPFAGTAYLAGRLETAGVRCGSDDFAVRFSEKDGRRFVFLFGGRKRSLLYAVYAYFETCCGCRWFWDGDRVPRLPTLPMTGADLTERPRFAYRGIRYFAHRGLTRFQAEHWGFEDWKKEIDWLLKKRLNLFMLRIGNDDLFQKAFPDAVSYPSETEWDEDKPGFHDRTSAWDLRYRGRLRKKILDYAFARDLMHPEDCGTVTHWYSPTPKDFLEKEKPAFFPQTAGSNYRNFPQEQVWDVRDRKNMDCYIALTETHIREYGNGGIFHTIGFAERNYSEDRAENMRMKRFVYDKVLSYLAEKHPNAPLLMASWDFWHKYTKEEAKALLEEMDPDRVILLDYTSDTALDNNFTNWGVIGRFPYCFGIFQAYCNNSGALGSYERIEERLAVAARDPACRGMVFWPELSHGESLMHEFFTKNAWRPGVKAESMIAGFCRDRYPESAAGTMENVWRDFFPFIPLITWDGHHAELFFNSTRLIGWVENKDARVFSVGYPSPETLRGLLPKGRAILSTLASLETEDEFVLRDLYDIARVTVGRYIHSGLAAVMQAMARFGAGERAPDDLPALFETCVSLTSLLAEILGQHRDYSLLASFEDLFREAPVHPRFETTLKKNASCAYNRTYVFEHIRALYLPELNEVGAWIRDSLAAGRLVDGAPYLARCERIANDYLASPLSSIDRGVRNRLEVFSDAAETIGRF